MNHQTRTSFFGLGSILLFLFATFSYVVKKKWLLQIDFDTTVKLQDKVSHRFDTPFSFFSLLGSFEITSVIIIILAIFLLIKNKKIYLSLGLLYVAMLFEVLGKVFILHPAPPFFMHRYDLGLNFPSSYVHTDFSYPSGHMLRTAFLATILIVLVWQKIKNARLRYFALFSIIGFSLVMFISRVYLAEHWLTDVFGGLLLGVAFAFFALSFSPTSHKKLPF